MRRGEGRHDHPDFADFSGGADISYWDTKHTGHWDMIGYHPDGKLKPSSYGPYIPEAGTAAANSENSGK